LTNLNATQLQFLQKYLNMPAMTDGGEETLKSGPLARRTLAAIAAHPRAERVLNGLLGAVYAAENAGDEAGFSRCAELLTDRLDTLQNAPDIPDIKSVVELGLAEASQMLLPEDPAIVEAAFEEARAAMGTLPDGIRDAAVAYEAELIRLRARGDALVAKLEKGDLPPTEAAAHHSEVDQICVRLEVMTSEFQKVFLAEGVL
jgi:hypothetical protein